MGMLDIINMMLPLILISILLGGAYYFIKKKSFIQNISKYKAPVIDVITTKSIMPKKYITVVRIEDKIMVLGVSDGSISVLQEKDFDNNMINETAESSKVTPFFDVLKMKMNNK